MVLLCNDPQGQERLLDALAGVRLGAPDRAQRMRRRGGARDLRKSVAYREAQQACAALA
jgi:hypothetical protein